MTLAPVRTSALTAAIFVLVASGALAQQPTPPKLDPNLMAPAPGFETPYVARADGETGSSLKLPDHIDFGTSQLRLDTEHKDPIPRVGIDAVDPAILNPGLAQSQDTKLTPKYFGFTLSTPTH